MLNVPLMSGDRPLGSIVVTNKIQGVYGPDDEWILGALAPAAVIGLENARLYAQAEGLARLQERQRIAQSLHDSLAQMLFGLGLQVREMLADPGLDGSVRRKLKVVGRLAGRSSYDLRNAIYALRSRQSPAGALEGLQEQIEAFQAASDISATLITPSDLPALPDSLSDVFCLVTREALSNVRKHAHASAVVVSLRCDGDTFVLTIQDNGIGLDAAKVGGDGEDELHFGIDSMRDIVNRAGGEFLLSSNDDAGTTVRVQMPVPEGHTT